MRRVVITGMGVVSSLGLTTEETWRRVLAGDCGVGPLTKHEMPGEPVRIAAEVVLPPFSTRKDNFCERIALMATEECLKQADLAKVPFERRGVFQGAATSGLPASEQYALDRLANRVGRATGTLGGPKTVTSKLAARLDAHGPQSTIMNACSSSLMALGEAWERIALGEIDAALAGGCEGICRTTFAGFASLKAMDTALCRPFSRDRAGLNLGEGAVQFLLEDLDAAKRRGAVILGEVRGYGTTMDAHHPTAPHPEGDGAARAMIMALRMAQLNPADIDLVSAHATATPANDGAECQAIQRTLGEAAQRVSVTASKSQFGHTLAAAGAFGAALALLSLRDQVVSPTLRLEEPDPLCQLDCTPKHPKARSLRAALVNAFAFGGNNVCLAITRWEGK